MSMATDKILNRIKKLLAMGQGNANENEATIAMRRALHLMAEYNLNLGDFEDAPEENIDESRFDRKRGGPWARTIANGIAKLYFCKYFYTNLGKRHDVHHFVGKESNRKVAEMVTNFVLDTIDGEAKRTAVADPRTGTKTPYLNSFRNAASHRIFFRCEDLIKESQEEVVSEYSGTTLPALASLYQVAEVDNLAWLNHRFVIGKSKGRSRSSSAAGSNAGREAGNQVSLRPNVSNQKTNRLN